MTAESGEQGVTDTVFGTVTTRRVIYFANKGWFSGGSREDVPLRQVVSVRYEIKRSIFLGLLVTVLGLVLLIFVVGIIVIPFGLIMLWGSPVVNIVTSGGTQSPAIGFPWQRQQAEQFVKAVREQLAS
jgi:hypothetical protein